MHHFKFKTAQGLQTKVCERSRDTEACEYRNVAHRKGRAWKRTCPSLDTAIMQDKFHATAQVLPEARMQVPCQYQHRDQLSSTRNSHWSPASMHQAPHAYADIWLRVYARYLHVTDLHATRVFHFQAFIRYTTVTPYIGRSEQQEHQGQQPRKATQA